MSNLGTELATILNDSQDITFNIEDGCQALRQLITKYDVSDYIKCFSFSTFWHSFLIIYLHA